MKMFKYVSDIKTELPRMEFQSNEKSDNDILTFNAEEDMNCLDDESAGQSDNLDVTETIPTTQYSEVSVTDIDDWKETLADNSNETKMHEQIADKTAGD